MDHIKGRKIALDCMDFHLCRNAPLLLLGQRVLVFYLHHEVVNVCFNIGADLWSQAGIHDLLEIGPDVLQAKGDTGLILGTFKHDEYNPYFVF
jgi:hypothetical protein